MIYLLDLNYTLVANSPPYGSKSIRPFIRQIEQEQYRQWLVELLRPHMVILITARPDCYREVTLNRIKAITGWSPMDAVFGRIKARPHLIKEHLLLKHVFPKYGRDGFFALESNPRTQAMYLRYCIPSIRITGEGISDNGIGWIIGLP